MNDQMNGPMPASRLSASVGLRAGATALLATCVLLFASPVAAQQVSERLRASFARAETLFRTGQADLAIEPLTVVIDALLADALNDRVDNEGRALLVRSLAYRADAYIFNGERSVGDADLEQLLTLYPRVAIAGFALSDGVLDRFSRAQANLIGTLTLQPTPLSARVRVDGENVPPQTTSYRVLAGTHYVEIFLPGFTRYAEEIEVRADRPAEVNPVLQRVSAVIRLMTRPAGATVVVDGSVVGQTVGTAPRDWTPTPDLARYPRHEFSGVMEIEGLMPGRHEVEVLMDGYRAFSAPISIPDLADFQVGTIVLNRNLGMVLLRDLSPDAEVWIDGRRTQPEPPSRGAGGEMASTAYRLSLPPGQYRITVSRADAGVFEESVTVADRRNLALTVRLRPGLTFLGVAGADRLGADALQESLTRAFGGLNYWTFLDRSTEAQRLLQRTGATAERLRSAAVAGVDSAGDVDWQRLQATVSRELPGSVFVLAVLDDDELAALADLWIWPAAPGPAVAERVRISLSDASELDRLARRLSEPMSFARPWAGLELIDSGISANPVVAAIAAGGPAAAAGVQLGESLITVAGNDVATVAGAGSWLSTFAPGAMVAIGVRGPAGDRTVELRMGSTPTVVGPTEPDRLYSVIWGMTAAAVGRMDAPAPTWLAQLNQAAVLLHVRDWQAAAELLGAIQAPAGAGVGQGLVDYWLGIALAEAGDPDAARAAFERVLDSPQARYLSNDGPYLAPMARARMLAIDALRSP